MSVESLFSNSFVKSINRLSNYDNLNTNTIKTFDTQSKIVNFNNCNFLLKPNGSKYFIAKFSVDSTYSYPIFNFDVDTSLSSVGDKLVIMVTNQNTSDILDIEMGLSTNFFYTHCGNYSPISYFNLERISIPFYFDGEKYVNTADSC